MSDNNEDFKNEKPNNVSEQVNLNEHNHNLNTPPKKIPWGDIFLGLGLSFLLIIAIVASLYIGQVGIISIVVFILLVCSTFLSVRFIRRGTHPIAGKILLVIIIPLTLLLLLFGACAVSLGGL